MRIVYFAHSLASCWNHGNAHFLRGVLSELAARGHDVAAFEAAGNWSLSNLLEDHGEAGLAAWRSAYPELKPRSYDCRDEALAACADADLVIVHEWNPPELVAGIGRARRHSCFQLLFHDTHHRAVSDPAAIDGLGLGDYDGVLAFGEALAAVYRRRGWGDRVFVWHEGADLRRFHPPAVEQERHGLVWIGNWGDGERSAELEEFLLAPAQDAGLALTIHGVRYPPAALELLARYGARYCGWLANAAAPEVFARHIATVHVPRRFYATQLPGIPTIRIFEALACGIPLVSAPWDDCEGLFRPGEDYLVARNGAEMTRHIRALAFDPALRAALAASGLERISARHSCAHRADELLAIAAELMAPPAKLAEAR